MAHDSRRLAPASRRWYDGLSRYLAFATTLISIAAALVVFFKTGRQIDDVKELVAVCIGLIGLAVSLQLEILFRVAERTATRDRYSRVLEGIEDFPDLLPVAAESLDASVATLKRTAVPQFRDEVFKILTHASVRLQELAQGRLRTDGSDNTLVLERFAEAAELIRGTTDDADTGWWGSDDGKRFTELNARLISRGVRIDRIWILDAPPSTALRRLLSEHHDMGINVFMIRADRRDMDQRLLVNMTIRDNDFLQQDILNRSGRSVEYLYSENPTDLERAGNVFAQLRSKATKYMSPESISELFPEGGALPLRPAESGSA
jgi:hypothetical protein